MSQLSQAGASVVLPGSDDPRWAMALRVSASHTFERSHRLQRFLLDVASHTLAGRTNEITEQQIGMRVFGKPADYNPAEDNTVRAQARLLRLKLEEYYASEGASDPIRIQIPKGAYVPVFTPLPEEVTAPVPPAVRPAEQPLPMVAPPARVNRILAVVCGLLLLAVAWLWHQKRVAESILPPLGAAGTLTSLVIAPAGKPTTIVLADSGLVAAESLAQQEISLADYTGPAYRWKVGASHALTHDNGFWGYLLSRRYTSIADVSLYGRLLQLHPASWKNMRLRHARDLQVRDLRDNNFILLGSNRSNPWLELFNDKLDFQFDVDPNTRLAFIRNKHPQAGEPAAYESEAMPSGSGKAFAYIALISNLTDTGSILVIAGTTAAATDAAAEYACDPHASQNLARLWGLSDLSRIKSFELVFDTAIVSETAKSEHVVASRHTLKKS